MARKRLKLFEYQQILEQMRAGTSARTIALKGLASRNKVKSVREAAEAFGWLDPTAPMPSPEDIMRVFPAPAVPVRESSLEPYRVKVKAWAEEGHAPKQIFRALKREEPQFTASVGAVKRFLKRLGVQTPKAFVVLHFEPGEAAQVDFGSGPLFAHPKTGKPTRTHFFVMTLCHSRHAYAEVVWDQKVDTWLRCHRNALEFFGGVVGKIIIDNLKSAITKACFHDPEVQRGYEQFAKDYGFQIAPCKARRPWHKGRVEAGVKYVKTAFLPLRTFRSLADANQQLLEWVLGEAGNRIHGTTQEMPLKAFAEREKQALKPLPDPRPEMVTWEKAKLHPNCHVSFQKSFYSASYRLVGELLTIRASESLVELYLEDQGVGMHARAQWPGTWRTNEEHYPPEKIAHMQRGPQWCLLQAQIVGPSCHEFISKLLGDRVVDRLSGAQGIVRGFSKKYGFKRVDAACARALDFENIRYRAVKTILEKGLDQVSERPDASGQLHFPFLEAPRFARNIGQMLTESGGRGQ